MQTAIHFKTIVLPGHKIEITNPDLREGETVEVVVKPETPPAPARSIFEIIDQLHGHRRFQNPEDTDRDLQQERDAWDR